MFEWVRASDEGDRTSPAPLMEMLGQNKNLSKEELTVPVGQDVLAYKGKSDSVFMVLEGWIAAHRMMPNGIRQIIDFKLPTDFLHFHSRYQQGVYSGFETLTEAKLVEFSLSEILDLSAKDPRFRAEIMREVAREDAIRTERLISLARRSATQRTAHLMLELSERLQRAGLATRAVICGLPSQASIADALALTTVHLSRVLKQLRADGLLNFKRSRVEFLDRAKLVQETGFEPDYLT